MTLNWIFAHGGWQVVLIAAIVWASWAAIRHVEKHEVRQLHQRNDPLFRQVLEQQGLRDVEILRDNTALGSQTSPRRPFTVHLILRSAPNLWWVYIHVEGSDPVLKPISEARGRAALS